MDHMRVLSICTLLFFICCQTAIANDAQKSRVAGSLGFGAQYAVFGVQISRLHHRHKLYFSTSIFTYAAGYEYAITEKVSLGANAYYALFGSGASLNLNYHFTSAYSRGWVLGLDVIRRSSLFRDDDDEEQDRHTAFFSIGFKT